MLGSTRIIDLSVSQFSELIKHCTREIIEEALAKKASDDIKNKTYSINELAETNLVGKYHRIKSLIASGALTQLSDGKISGFSLYQYLNNKKS